MQGTLDIISLYVKTQNYYLLDKPHSVSGCPTALIDGRVRQPLNIPRFTQCKHRNIDVNLAATHTSHVGTGAGRGSLVRE